MTAALSSTDAVGAADRLRMECRRRIDGVLGEVRPPGVSDVRVGWFEALDAANCPARYRAGGEDGWGFPGWSPLTAAAGMARAALVRHIEDHERVGRQGPPPLPRPLETVRAWLREVRSTVTPTGRIENHVLHRSTGSLADWIIELSTAHDGATLAAAAALATRWIAGFVRVHGWPPHDRLRLFLGGLQGGGAPGWTYRTTPPIAVAGGPDGRAGKVTASGDFSLIVHRMTGGDDGRVIDRAAFEAAAGGLAVGVVPASVLVSAGDTGERITVRATDDVVAHGVDLIVGVLRQRVIATERGFDPVDATPSVLCRTCHLVDECAPGREWVAGPGRWRAGLPVLSAPGTMST